MSRRLDAFLLWCPRVLGIGLAAFLSLFALDAFGAGESVWHALPDFFIHLLPAAVVLVVVGLSWRRPWIGGMVFLGLAAIYAASAYTHPSWVMTISGPLLLVGVLFLLSWRHQDVGQRKHVTLT